MLYPTAYWVGMPFVYERADLPDDRIVRNIPYWLSRDADPDKNRLDLFLPETESDAKPWPALVFVHGGGWVEGDRNFRAGGRDVYANIGRFFASHGVGTAVISYRLQPQVTWHEQVDDVAHAVAWVHDHIEGYGGNPKQIFVSGHSAGAQLSAWVALDPERLASLGAGNPKLCGLIPVSGAALDLTDQETYRLGASPAYFERRFRNGGEGSDWKREASPVFAARADAPETLILYAKGEPEDLKRQSVVLDVWLRAAGADSRIVEVPGEDHYRIILTLSRPDKTAGPAMLEFIETTDCPAN
jgi:acetyl esterase/lipase